MYSCYWTIGTLFSFPIGIWQMVILFYFRYVFIVVLPKVNRKYHHISLLKNQPALMQKKRYYIGHGAIKTTYLTQLFWIRKPFFFFLPFHESLQKKFCNIQTLQRSLYINRQRCDVNTPFLIENGNEFFFAKTFETNFLAGNLCKKLRKNQQHSSFPPNPSYCNNVALILLHTPLSLKFWTSFWNYEFKKIE